MAGGLPGYLPCVRLSLSAFPARPKRISQLLLDWLQDAKIDRVGSFKYEPVAGAAADALGNLVPAEVKAERYGRLMARQQDISTRRLKRKVGTRQHVIIDEVGPTVARGRSKGDAPEIDGAVHVSSRRPLRQGGVGSLSGSSAPISMTCMARLSDSDTLLTNRHASLYGRSMNFETDHDPRNPPPSRKRPRRAPPCPKALKQHQVSADFRNGPRHQRGPFRFGVTQSPLITGETP